MLACPNRTFSLAAPEVSPRKQPHPSYPAKGPAPSPVAEQPDYNRPLPPPTSQCARLHFACRCCNSVVDEYYSGPCFCKV
jgi:hypothetical protein